MKKIWIYVMTVLSLSSLAYASAEENLLDSANAIKNMIYDSKIKIPEKVRDNAQAIAIFPGTIEISMFLGGRTGEGVMVVRKDNGTWSYPFFVKLGVRVSVYSWASRKKIF